MTVLNLNDLRAGDMPGITSAIGNAMAESSAVCLDSQGHTPGVVLVVRGWVSDRVNLIWTPATIQARRGWNDLQEATEEAAEGVATLLARWGTGYVVLLRSRKGTGFDYLLGDSNVVDISEVEKKVTAEWAPVLGDNSLVVRARFEVSGILRGSENIVKGRTELKLKQVSRSDDSGIPAYVIVVEFRKPLAEVTRK